MSDLLYLDTETTGLSYETSQVVELAYAVGDGDITTLVLPHTIIAANPRALEINRYHARGLADRTTWATEQDIARAFADMQGKTLFAANPRFDSRMLERTFGFLGNQEPWSYRLFDVQSYAAGVLGLDVPTGMAQLFDLLTMRGFVLPKPDHSAAGDVAAMRAVHRILVEYRASLAPSDG